MSVLSRLLGVLLFTLLSSTAFAQLTAENFCAELSAAMLQERGQAINLIQVGNTCIDTEGNVVTSVDGSHEQNNDSNSGTVPRPSREVEEIMDSMDGVDATAASGADKLRKGAGGAGGVMKSSSLNSFRAERAAVEACESAASSTASDCSAEKSDNAMSGASSAIATATQAINAGGGAAACGHLNSATQAANAAMVAVKGTCMASFNTCQKACSTSPISIESANKATVLQELRDRFVAARTRCNRASSQVAGIDQNIAQLQAAQARAGQCQADAAAQAALANGGSGLSAQCRLNPNLPICSGSSTSLPSMAAMRGGVGGANGASKDGGGMDGDPSGLNGDLPGGGPGDTAFGTNGLPIDPNAQAANGGGGMPSPAGGGPGGGSGKGANKAEAPGKPTRVASKFNLNVLGGNYGSSRGGAFAAAKEAGTYNPNGSWIPPKVGPNPLANVNLDKFRPNMRGYRHPTTEGNRTELLASHVNIWKQMNLRYMSVTKSLMP